MKVYSQDTFEVLFIDETEIELQYQVHFAQFSTTDSVIFFNKTSLSFYTNHNYESVELKLIFKPKNSNYNPNITILFDELSMFINEYVVDTHKTEIPNNSTSKIKYLADILQTACVISPSKSKKSKIENLFDTGKKGWNIINKVKNL
ncbi:hypothetical protein RF11_04509 [Thelohanellus kitauei]|uniref:Uncharacterized protein n=1 Tax=Thelohanellus kitauei TaxID=669202 RepID=A0A0C2MKC1_THEKT|nr:hypothetical protein RF11_04509 [Thelohanellus kitauei]